MDNKSHKGFPPRLFRFFAAAAISLSSSFVAQAASTSLMWDPSSGSDVAGYKLRYGTSSRNYDKVLDVRNATQATVSSLTEGSTYYFAVTAYNTAGVESTFSNEVSTKIATAPNQNPMVSLTSPAQGSSVTRGTQVALAATASDPDGTVANVAFFVGGTKISEDTTAPYTATWTPTQAGSYSIVARVTDNRGAVVSSQTVTVQVTNGASGGGSSKKPPKAKFTTLLESSSGDSSYAGSVTLNTSANGTYSGVVKYQGKSYEVKGQLNSEGRATKKITRTGQPDLVLNIAASDEDWTGLSGTLSDGTTELKFSAGKTAGSGEQANRNAGTYSILLPPVEPTTASNSYPQGTGIAALVINNQGTARLTGTLADGTSISQGGQITADGKYLVYIPLYGKKGLLAGAMQLRTSDSAPKVVSGSLQWNKPATASGKYREGFKLTLDVIGSLRRAASAGNPGENPRAGAAMTLTVFGGDLNAPIEKRITFNQKGRPQPITGPEKVTFEILNNGKFSGTFRDPATSKRHSFKGFFLESQSVGAGFFLGKKETGGVILETAE